MFLGLDLSLSATGAVLIDENYTRIEERVLSSTSKEAGRLFALERYLLDFIEPYISKIKLICIESPAYGVSEGNLFHLGQWSGVVELNLFKLTLPYLFASPSQLKKYVLGSGRGEKSLMLLKTYQNFGEEFNDDNICDAYGLSRIARDYYVCFTKKEKTKLTKSQNEVLIAIDKNVEARRQGDVLK